MKRNFEEILDGINSKHYSNQNTPNGESLKNFIDNKLVREISLEKKKLINKDTPSLKKIIRGFTLSISDLSGDSIDKKLSLLLPISSADYTTIRDDAVKQIESEGYAFLSASFGEPLKILSSKQMALYTDVAFTGLESEVDRNSKSKELVQKSGFKPKRG